MFPSKTLQWTTHDDWAGGTGHPGTGPPCCLSSGNTWPTESFLIVCRQNKCNVVDPQAEARPSVPYVRSVLFLPAWTVPAYTVSVCLFLLPSRHLSPTKALDVTHRWRKVPWEPRWFWARLCFPPSQHPEEVDARGHGWVNVGFQNGQSRLLGSSSELGAQ